ncbi:MULTISPECIES: N-acyl homoserine lactonase family protein [Streptomyces]|uniref:N-acyl homoserine lactonase family protein n=1 Tax=Streptomyces TaxID=1883 RepID=UPI0036A8A90D
MTNTTTANPAGQTPVRIYTLDGGLTVFQQGSIMSDTGEFQDRPVLMPAPAFLIQHGNRWLLWDTGNGDRIADLPGGSELKFGGRFSVSRTLKGQLAELGLEPDDIEFVALSHLHQDHTGNVGLFPQATFLVSAAELAFARQIPTPFGIDGEATELLNRFKVDALDFDHDVFGDGSVTILRAPGHTPGSLVLLVKLENSGAVLLSGDLFHLRENYEKQLVPVPNASRADTLASFDRFAKIVANTDARVVVQHDPGDFAGMPTFPKYLD